MRRLLAMPDGPCFAGAMLVSACSPRARRPAWVLARSRWRSRRTTTGRRPRRHQHRDGRKKTSSFSGSSSWAVGGKASSFSEPLLFPGLITGRGFKDLAFLGDANTLYAVDSELGELVWQKDFKVAHRHAVGRISRF